MAAPAATKAGKGQVADVLKGLGLGGAAVAVGWGLYSYLKTPKSGNKRDDECIDPAMKNVILRYNHRDNCLYYADIFDDTVWKQRLTSTGEKDGEKVAVLKFREGRDEKPSGLGWREDGSLVVLCGETRRLVLVPPGADPSAEPQELMRLDKVEPKAAYDMTFDERGGCYIHGWGCSAETYFYTPDEVELGSVIYVPPEGLAKSGFAETGCTILGSQALPTGTVITPDGKTVYRTMCLEGFLMKNTRDPKTGALSEPEQLFEFKGCLPMGLALDEEDCVWVAIPSVYANTNSVCPYLSSTMHLKAGQFGVLVRFDPKSKRILETTTYNPQGPTSLSFGGPDGKTLYMACTEGCMWTQKDYSDEGNSKIQSLRVGVGGKRDPKNKNYLGGLYL